MGRSLFPSYFQPAGILLKIGAPRKDAKSQEFEYCFFRSIPLGTELKNFIINEHVLNGEPNYVITLQGLNSESIQNMLSYFLYRGHRYGSWGILFYIL